MGSPNPAQPDAASANGAESLAKIHLLDPGATAYGDCVLCQFGSLSVLIDGAHPGDYRALKGHRSIPDQLAELLGQKATALSVDLLLITHTHSDHFGCLPRLIREKTLKASWALVADPDLGWGRLGPEPDAPRNPAVRQVLEYVRDDNNFEVSSFADAAELLSDAATQEQDYRDMITVLGQTGHVATFIGSDPDTGEFEEPTQAVIDHFSGLGLKLDILGPSGLQAVECARQISDVLNSARGAAEDMLAAGTSDGPSLLKAFASDSMSSDARTDSRAGNYVNLQSLVTLFTWAGRKYLFSGDMQLADPRASHGGAQVNPVITGELSALLASVRSHAPYDFVKIGHHGSYNAFDEDILAAYGQTSLFGISTGEFSPSHPDPHVAIPILKRHRKSIQWGRTDYNRRCTFTFAPAKASISLEADKVNELRLNKSDLGGDSAVVAPIPAPAVSPVTPTPVTSAPASSATITVPLSLTLNVSVTVDTVQSGAPRSVSISDVVVAPAAPAPAPPVFAPAVQAGDPTRLSVGAGRDFSKLLFVTSAAALQANIGENEAETAMRGIRDSGAILFDAIPAASTAANAIAAVQKLLQANTAIEGVVIVGGHDVVPHQIFDCLPPSFRITVDTSPDDDDFVVWNDAAYGRRNPQSLQEVPVSRIPDCHLSKVLLTSLQASRNSFPAAWSGIRNLLRPFADEVFRKAAASQLLVSHPFIHTGFPPTANPPHMLESEYLYIMLHGDHVASDRFRGNKTSSVLTDAFFIDNVPSTPGQVVFAGCCWGALTTTVRACDISLGQAVGMKQPATSIALRFLERGALAYIGCTGMHWSPREDAMNTAGGAMHFAFFEHLVNDRDAAGKPISPAQALFRAKLDYARDFPHGEDDPFTIAAEYKSLHQFTCLGLGW